MFFTQVRGRAPSTGLAFSWVLAMTAVAWTFPAPTYLLDQLKKTQVCTHSSSTVPASLLITTANIRTSKLINRRTTLKDSSVLKRFPSFQTCLCLAVKGIVSLGLGRCHKHLPVSASQRTVCFHCIQCQQYSSRQLIQCLLGKWGVGEFVYSSRDSWAGVSRNIPMPVCFHLQSCPRVKTDDRHVPWRVCVCVGGAMAESTAACRQGPLDVHSLWDSHLKSTPKLIPERWWNGYRDIPKCPDLCSFSRDCLLMKIKPI